MTLWRRAMVGSCVYQSYQSFLRCIVKCLGGGKLFITSSRERLFRSFLNHGVCIMSMPALINCSTIWASNTPACFDTECLKHFPSFDKLCRNYWSIISSVLVDMSIIYSTGKLTRLGAWWSCVWNCQQVSPRLTDIYSHQIAAAMQCKRARIAG